jgi:hypothetical protein
VIFDDRDEHVLGECSDLTARSEPTTI